MQLNPQLSLPPRRRRFGLGDSLSEFNTLYSSDPAIRSAWDPVNAQLQREGADITTTELAKAAFADAFDQLGQQIGVDPNQAIAAAQQYVQAGHTVAGMVGNIQALINNSGGTPPGTALQAVGGTLVGFATLAGALSAGVGAAIVAGVALIGEALNALVGGGNPGVEVCPGIRCNPPPQWAITCTCAYGTPANPGTNAWKNFPDPTKIEDSDWYAKTAVQNWPASQSPSAQISVSGSLRDTFFLLANVPLVYQAFAPMWHLSCEQQALLPGSVGDFQRAFFSAWKANAAYTLNGLKAATDTQVLIHVARIWNRTHEPGAGYDIQPSSMQVETYPIYNSTTGVWSSPTGKQLMSPHGSASCAINLDPYEAILVGGGDPTLRAGQANFQGTLATSDPLLNGQALHINTGPSKNIAAIVTGGVGTRAATSTVTTSRAAPALAGVAAAGVFGTVAYSYLTGKAIDTVARSLWTRIVGVFK